jgi:UDP-3-O-[3-hydroxymyristoyl] glucosamine N-acyltransferase
VNYTAKDLAHACGLDITNGDASVVIDSAASIDDAGPGQLSYIARSSGAGKLGSTRATAVIAPRGLTAQDTRESLCVLAADDPEIAFINCLKLLYPPTRCPAGVSDSARVDSSAAVGESTFVDGGVSIGRRARIGSGCTILAGCYVGDDVEIADNCTLHPNVVLYHGTILRENVTVHAGTVIGADGYGYKQRKGVHVKFPQVGRVLIERDVEIGANACIDRAALGFTIVGEGTKIDNHVHVAHNVRIGKGVLILGQTGIGGSAVIEDYAILASQCGISDHVRIGSRAVVLAKSGVISDIQSGAQVIGFPAADRRDTLREMATLRRLAEVYKPLKELAELLPELKAMLERRK